MHIQTLQQNLTLIITESCNQDFKLISGGGPKLTRGGGWTCVAFRASDPFFFHRKKKNVPNHLILKNRFWGGGLSGAAGIGPGVSIFEEGGRERGEGGLSKSLRASGPN